MSYREVLKQTLATLRAHKLRSFLTMFGIIWGIASVILLEIGRASCRERV